MADFSFGFTEGSFLLLNGRKHLISVAEDLTSNKQKRTERIYQKRRRHGHKILKPIFLNTILPGGRGGGGGADSAQYQKTNIKSSRLNLNFGWIQSMC